MTSITHKYPISTKKLKQKWEELYSGFNDDPDENKEFEKNHQLLLRLQRAISWLDIAQQVERGIEGEERNLSARFIFFWISFNALYEKNMNLPKKRSEHIKLIKEYFDDIDEDAQSRICNVIRRRRNLGPANNLTENIFVWPGSWKKIRQKTKQGYHRDEILKMLKKKNRYQT